MVSSTAIWRITLLRTTMLPLHKSVVNFNVQPLINKYQVVITLLPERKNTQVSIQQEMQQEALTHTSRVLILVFSALPFPHATLTPALDNDAKTATVAKALDFHSNYQACALSTAQHVTVYIYYAQAHKNILFCTVTCR